MSVVDAFYYCGEFDLLELRIHELCNVVDYFIVYEAKHTHSLKEKPLYYEEQRDRFSQYTDKICYFVQDELPPQPSVRENYNFQREYLKYVIRQYCQEGDIVLYSAVDEIPRAELVSEYSQRVQLGDVYGFQQRFFYYWLNCEVTSMTWFGTRMFLYTGDDISLTHLRDHREYTIVESGGWHFSHLGGVERIIRKIEASLHTEWDTPYYKDPQRIERCITTCSDLYGRHDMSFSFVKVDRTYPPYLLQNINNFVHLIYKPDTYVDWSAVEFTEDVARAEE